MLLTTTLLLFGVCIKVPFSFEHYPVKDLFCHQTVNRNKRCGSHICYKADLKLLISSFYLLRNKRF